MSSPDQVVGEESAPATLSELGTRFAEDVSNRVARVVELDRPFSALANPETGRVAVAIYDNDGTELSIPLRIDGSVKLRLLIKFKCCWDTPAAYLAIDESMFHLRLSDRARDADNPLFRYEYLRQAKKNVPSAHLQVHAHRDEFVYLLAAGTRARAGDRQKEDRPVHVSEFHFPLGGHRFRPCVEDVLQAIIWEFGVDTKDGWRAAISEGREEWRRTQLKSAVRDAPQDAADALTDLGWTITPPSDKAPDNVDRLRSF